MSSEPMAPSPPTTWPPAPPPAPPARPQRCVVTLIGLVALTLGFLCVATILMWQLVSTGSFERGDGYLLGPYLADPMFAAVIGGLGLLVVGSIVDSVRYGRWRKATSEAKAMSEAK